MHMPTRGVRSLAVIDDVIGRARAYALVLPDDVVFSHLTAARLWGLPLPWRLDRGDAPLDVMRRSGKARLERRGCVTHRGLERREVAMTAGLPVTSVADTWCDIIEKYHSTLTVADAVVTGDAAVELLVRTGPIVDEWGRVVFDKQEVHPQTVPGTSQWWSEPVNAGAWALVERAAERGRFRGRSLALTALPRLRPRVWSPMETRARLVVVDGGIREPRLNASVCDSRGEIITIGDLVWEEERALGAYNGLDHEGEPSRERDNSQRMRLEDEGWWVIEIYKSDVFTATGRAKLVRRIENGLRRLRR